MINRYAPPTARLDFANGHATRPFGFVAAACALELITFLVTWSVGFPLSDPFAAAFWIGTLGIWSVLAALAWRALRGHEAARKVLLWLLVLMSVYLALGLAGSFLLALPRAPPRLLWRMWFGVSVHLLQFALCVLALWSLRRARLAEPAI
jgi:hypothetical protein